MARKKKIIGYTAGVFDMFHAGHLNVLKESKKKCDYLIVAVSTDELVQEYKNKLPIIPFSERKDIIKSIRYVDKVVEQTTLKKIDAYEKYKFDVMFVGEDWKGTEKWKELEKIFKPLGVKIVYIKRKFDITSTALRDKIIKME